MGSPHRKHPAPILSDAEREARGLGRFWIHAFYGDFREYIVDPRVETSKVAQTQSSDGLYSTPRIDWHRSDYPGLPDQRTAERVLPRQDDLSDAFQRDMMEIIGGRPLSLFDKYLQYWRENGGPELSGDLKRVSGAIRE